MPFRTFLDFITPTEDVKGSKLQSPDMPEYEEYDYEYEFQEPDMMSHEVAMRQARQILDPQFEQAREGVIGEYGHQQAQRGFYGQAPATAATQQALAQLETQHTGQVAQAGQQLRHQDWQRGMQEEQMRAQEAQHGWQRHMQEQQLGMQGHQFDMQQHQIESEEHARWWQGIGQIVGGAAGFAIGGPAGAVAGAQLGGYAGG